MHHCLALDIEVVTAARQVLPSDVLVVTLVSLVSVHVSLVEVAVSHDHTIIYLPCLYSLMLGRLA